VARRKACPHPRGHGIPDQGFGRSLTESLPSLMYEVTAHTLTSASSAGTGQLGTVWLTNYHIIFDPQTTNSVRLGPPQPCVTESH
jgi:hypothetical protein